ncbi:MAG TPA: hypothetical protein VGL24_13060 [Chthoniobacterales bacterium]
MNPPDFFSELKRRNVVRMAGLHLVGAWLLVQVAGTVLPMFGAPDWIARSIVILLAIGFIPALIFSWVFELTPQGLKRDEDVRPEESIAVLPFVNMTSDKENEFFADGLAGEIIRSRASTESGSSAGPLRFSSRARPKTSAASAKNSARTRMSGRKTSKSSRCTIRPDDRRAARSCTSGRKACGKRGRTFRRPRAPLR